MAAVVANKVKRNRSARHSNKQGGVQLEIDAHGKLRKVGGEEEEAKKKREAAKRPNAGYYRKVRADEVRIPCDVRCSPQKFLSHSFHFCCSISDRERQGGEREVTILTEQGCE